MVKVSKPPRKALKTKKRTIISGDIKKVRKPKKNEVLDVTIEEVEKENEKKTADQPKTTLDVDLDQVKLAIEGIFKLTKDTVSKKLFDDEYPILLQVTCIKIPRCPDRIIRLPLKRSILTDTGEVCLIVPDLKKGRRVDYNPTIEHYQQILQQNDINQIHRIIPVNCIKTEYDQFELKRRLVGQYDLFLADGRICGHLSHLLGKTFYQKRKLPTPVHLSRPNLKHTIEEAILKTQMHIHSKGNTFLTQIGNSKMTPEEIVLNFVSVAESLAKQFPGGWDNIRAIHVKSHLSIAIPVYMTLKNGNSVAVPKIQPKRPKQFKEVTGELSTKLNKEVTVLPSGDIKVTKIKKNTPSLK